ncbi:DEAD/DEAH box helicase family protein [Archangium violaceum]|uniref:DEAD/DEAH box helicase family protein n=1 Tax=Archangium violaceum TaxID=83451 RepID=UPI002B27DE30|nr:DEAD/DEAH box helicase family protein [Archangium gephyra]
MSSPFLKVPESEWVASNTLAFAIRDPYPVSTGHTLVIPRRLVANWFDATPEEQRALFDLVDVVKRGLEESTARPDGYNIGINVGTAAGQTVLHLHVHVIPRYRGDMADPRGGVRHVIPGKGNYLVSPSRHLATGGLEDPFLQHVTPLLARATDVAVLAAFVQESGLVVLREAIHEALMRGANVRLLTGDYLSITPPSALRQLLDWMNTNEVQRDEGAGIFEARVVEEKDIQRAFHPKTWRFEGPALAVAFVGSSNISHSALKTGVEMNLRVECDQNPGAYQEVVNAFEVWWKRARRLDAAWLAQYEQTAARRQPLRRVLPAEAEGLIEEPAPPEPGRREPHPIQREALAALADSRKNGQPRALVVLATGLGKTLLAALDLEAFEAALGRRARVLFLAHRSELLTQAATTLRPYLPHSEFGWFIGAQAELDANVIFASVQKLWRPENLARLRNQPAPDYVVLDEVHHATAPSYRTILEAVQPAFLLGLTATPERTDAGDVFGLFDDNVVYRADLGEGISRNLLVPFTYYGLKDDVEYENIPWRNRRFDPVQLAAAVQTEARMQRMWRAWKEHPATRTLVFCASVSHAEYVRNWLRQQDLRAVAVHSGADTDDRETALLKLASGELDAVCAVDIFNEGVDVPSVDRVVMLRPTESQVVFMQQLGRGLRKADGKSSVTIIDFVGNHQMFLDRIQELLSLGSGRTAPSLRDFLVDGKQPALPPGCSVDVELEAKSLLAGMLPKGKGQLKDIYRELRHAWGRRPTMEEMHRLGYLPNTLGKSWFHFLKEEGDLTEEQLRALEGRGTGWFRELQHTPMIKSFKMVLLQVLLNARALEEGLLTSELTSRSLDLLRQDPHLHKDIEWVAELGGGREPDPQRFPPYWKANPINAWAEKRKWFREEDEGEHFDSLLPITRETRDAFHAMTQELVDYRLARYLDSKHLDPVGPAFEARVSPSTTPILRLKREKNPHIPPEKKEELVTLPDGSIWTFKFVKIAVNTAWPAGSRTKTNRLPELLRQWFGSKAGTQGTSFRVLFKKEGEHWQVEPAGAAATPLPERRAIATFPSLKAAAGAASDSLASAPEEQRVHLPPTSSGVEVFAVRASGDSMNGGESPIRDGDWLVMRYVRGVGIGALNGERVLVQVPDISGNAYQVKRVVRQDDRWRLRSDNPEYPCYDVTEEMRPIAQLVDIIPPERIGPFPGVLLEDEGVKKAFGLSTLPKTGRYNGHLFLCIGQRGLLDKPDRIKQSIPDRRPGETAFVLTRTRSEHPWRYAGIAYWEEKDGRWAIPEPVDLGTWEALGPTPEVE